ncbi:ABC transporter permease [Erwinia sp. INIA-01]|uniref:ABC transporter permease n=1 Tax=Erwinia sp. INIA01 TaxID=2991500 RepID=UPI0022247A46|nr:ABC transporter permease [Erwinia sp. INIA01]MCW1876968.1 ABC transporter permease [Erwinia sp. INIA01]
MKLWWQTFYSTLMRMLQKPMWMMLLLSLCVMSTVYMNRSVWDLPVAVIDMDHSKASRLITRQLNATPKVNTQIYENLPDALHDLGLRKLFAVVLMPQDLEQKMLSGKQVNIPVYGDATNRLANGQIELDVIAAYQQVLSQYSIQLMMKQGFSARQAEIILTPVVGQTVDVFNPGISFAAIVFPGLLVMLLQHSLLIAGVRVNLTLRSQGKLPLSVTLGALSALIPIWLFLSIVLFGLWPWVLGYRQTAPLAELLLLTLPFQLAVLGLAKLLTECIREVERIYLSLSFITTPVYYLSGTLWPVQSMPGWVRTISMMLPSTWGTRMIAGVNQMGLPVAEVREYVIVLLAMGAVYATAGFLVAKLRENGWRLRPPG